MMKAKQGQKRRRAVARAVREIGREGLAAHERLVEEQYEQRFSLGAISRGTGIPTSHLSRIFNGKRTPRVETARRICAFLGWSLDRLYAHVSTAQEQERTPKTVKRRAKRKSCRLAVGARTKRRDVDKQTDSVIESQPAAGEAATDGNDETKAGASAAGNAVHESPRDEQGRGSGSVDSGAVVADGTAQVSASD